MNTRLVVSALLAISLFACGAARDAEKGAGGAEREVQNNTVVKDGEKGVKNLENEVKGAPNPAAADAGTGDAAP